MINKYLKLHKNNYSAVVQCFWFSLCGERKGEVLLNDIPLAGFRFVVWYWWTHVVVPTDVKRNVKFA